MAEGNSDLNISLQNFIRTELGYKIIGSALTFDELEKNRNLHSANIVLLDTNLPQDQHFKSVKHIFNQDHRKNIIALTSKIHSVDLETIILLGFRGVIIKEKIYDEIGNAIDAILKGKMYFPTDAESQHSLISKE